jgi:hypothetical protein
MSTRFLHTADWQLGKPFAGIVDAQKRALVQQQRMEAVRALGRIERIELSARWFEQPKGFSVDRYFGGALGVMNGQEQHHVRIRFSPLAVDHVKDRFWHESQEWPPNPTARSTCACSSPTCSKSNASSSNGAATPWPSNPRPCANGSRPQDVN